MNGWILNMIEMLNDLYRLLDGAPVPQVLSVTESNSTGIYSHLLDGLIICFKFAQIPVEDYRKSSHF